MADDILKRLCDDDSSSLIRDAAAEIAALRAEKTALTKTANGTLPCDVMVAPRTIIRRGCTVETLLLAIGKRNGLPPEQVRFDFH